MTIAQLLVVLNWLVSAGIPILVALLTRAEASSTAKALTNLAGGLVATAVLTIVLDLSAHEAIDWFHILFALVTGFVVSGATYAHLWKPTGIAPVLATKGVTGGRHQAA
jgi:hypothetical protein